MEKANVRLRWGTEQRLEFIEFQAFWAGGVRRADLTGEFGISVPQASADLTLYQDRAPANLRYNSSEKRYAPTAEFAPQFLKPNADRFLVQLQAIANQVIGLDETWIAAPPDVGVMPLPARRVDPYVLSRLAATIRASGSIDVRYQSMNPNRPEAIWRRITPHAFGNDGLRWHVRAFCHLEHKFKDFIISRCREMRNEGKSGASPSDDVEWTSVFGVILRPNPELTKGQQQAIAADYDMHDGATTIPVRQALLYYFEKRLRLDLDPTLDGAAERPVVIVNRDEFNAARDAAMGKR